MLAGTQLTVFSAGLVASANFLGYLLGALLVSGTHLPGSNRLWLNGALLASAATTGAMGLGNSLVAFLFFRLVGGVASALVLVFASTAVLELLSERHGQLSSILFAGVGTGIAVSAILVSALLSAGAGWRLLWIASGALSLLGGVAAALLIPSPPQTNIGAAAGVMHRSGPLLRLIIAYGLFGFGYVITATFIVAIVRKQPEIGSLEPVIWVMFGLAAAPSVALWVRVADRFGIPAAFAGACMIEAAGVAASVAAGSALAVMLAAILVGGTFMGLTALGLMRARSLAPANSRRALAVMTSAFGLGQIVGPSLAGALAQWLGSFDAPSVLAAIALITAAALALF
jgi:predicted MFS family arabinose efflux permease